MADDPIQAGLFQEYRKGVERALSAMDRDIESIRNVQSANLGAVERFRQVDADWSRFRDETLPALRDRVTKVEMRVAFIGAGGGAMGAGAVELVLRVL